MDGLLNNEKFDVNIDSVATPSIYLNKKKQICLITF